MWYVLLSVVSSKTAVPSQHLRRVLVALMVYWTFGRLRRFIVWPQTAAPPGVASVRFSVAAVHSAQETSVGAAVAVFVRRSRRQAVDVNAAVEGVCLFSSARLCGTLLWSLKVCLWGPLSGVSPASVEVREGSVFGDQFVLS